MALKQEDFEQVGEYIKEHLSEWLAEKSLGKPPVVYEIELRERIIRVEEELKHQRELMLQGFTMMDKRFAEVDKRFEQVDKRFEEMREDMNKRFEQVDKRFEQVDKRFEQVDKRFETLTQRIDRFMVWSFGITITATGLIIAVIKLWN